MDFLEAERLFRQLKDEHRRGIVTGDTFAAEVGKIQVFDAQGHRWMLGLRSGNWYCLDENGEWNIGDPRATYSVPTRCLQCGQPLELGKGICDQCISEAAAQTSVEQVENRTAAAKVDSRYGNGVVRLAVTILVVIVICVFLFVFQMMASRWLPSSALSGSNATAAAVADTDLWPPLPLPTVSPEIQVSPTVVSPDPTPTMTSPDTAAPVTATPVVASPAWSPAPVVPTLRSSPSLTGRLVFPLFDSSLGTYHLYSASLDSGADLLQLRLQASQPHVNSAGQLAYRSWNDSSRGLMLAPLSGGDAVRLASYSEAARPSWASDGSELLFYSLQEGDRKARIYRTSPRGDFAVVKQGDATVFGEAPAWLPDGRFVIKSCPEGRCGLYVLGRAGGMALLMRDFTANAPEPSPDGRMVAFMSQRDGNWEVYVIGADGEGLLRLTHNSANDGLPTWAPGGQYLAFASDREGQWSIWAIRSDGSDERRLFRLPGSLDGRVRSAQSYESRGWTDERICWIP
jgi:hypothetical protein